MSQLFAPHSVRNEARRKPVDETPHEILRSLCNPEDWPPDWDDPADDEPDVDSADDSDADSWDAFEFEDEPDPEPGDFWGELDDDED